MAKGKDVIKLTDEDYKGKSFKTAPGGKYSLKFATRSRIKPGQNGNLLELVVTIASGPHKGINIFDNIAPHVGWKIAQLLKALGIKKKSLTLQELLKLIKKYGDKVALRAIIKEEKFNGKKQNKVVQFLPLEASDDDEDEDEEDEENEDEQEEQDDDDENDEDEDSDDEDDEDEDEDDEDEDEDEDEEDEDEDEDDEDEGDDEDEEDDTDDEEEDDEDKPVKKNSKKPAAKKAAAQKPVAKKAAKKQTRAGAKKRK